MRLQQLFSKNTRNFNSDLNRTQTLKPQRFLRNISNLLLLMSLVSLFSACTPYNDSLYSNGTNTRPFITKPANPSINNASTSSNTSVYYPDNTTNTGTSNNTVTPSNSNYAYYPITNTTNNNNFVNSNTNYLPNNTSTAPPSDGAIDYGVKALLDCTKELGYNVRFTANDYQNCLQATQATLTDYAFSLLGNYILSWTDPAIDKALQTLGFMNGRSLAGTQAKSSQLTSMIATGYRWY